ncbi:hypothetical protein OROHE_012300 [Orobanche hederae]
MAERAGCGSVRRFWAAAMGGSNCCSDRWFATAAFSASFSFGRIRAPVENRKDDDGPDGEARGLKRRIDDLDRLVRACYGDEEGLIRD